MPSTENAVAPRGLAFVVNLSIYYVDVKVGGWGCGGGDHRGIVWLDIIVCKERFEIWIDFLFDKYLFSSIYIHLYCHLLTMLCDKGLAIVVNVCILWTFGCI